MAAGKDDPCTGGEKGRANSRAVLEKAGFRNISVLTYEHMRHEILNETGNEKVYRDLLSFFLGGAARGKKDSPGREPSFFRFPIRNCRSFICVTFGCHPEVPHARKTNRCVRFQ